MSAEPKPRRAGLASALVRAAAATLLVAAGRALGAALAVQAGSGLAFPAAWRLVEVWAVIFAAPFLAIGLCEVPLRRALAADPTRRRWRDARLCLVTGVGWFALGGGLWPALGALGVAGAVGVAAGGWVGAALVPATAARQRRGWLRRGLALLPAAGLVAVLVAADPNARYEARYREGRARLAALPGLPARAEPAPPAEDGAPDGAGAATGSPLARRSPVRAADLDDLDLARAVAHTFMAANPPERLRWSWEEAVAIEGLLAYAHTSGDGAPFVYARAWVATHRAAVEDEPLWADAAAPGLIVLALRAAGRGDADDHRYLARLERYLLEDAPRTRLGAITHLGQLGGGLLPKTCWVDSLFMHGVYLDRLALEGRPSVRTGERVDFALDLARAQALAQAAYLQDPATGLFRHAFLETPGGGIVLPVEASFWARGNGWAAYFLVDHALARRRLERGDDAATRAILDRLLARLIVRQGAESGLWRTDLDAGPLADNPVETSASALIVAALRRALAEDLLGPALARDAREAVEGALPALKGRVRRAGERAIVTGTSIGTHPGFRRYYQQVRLEDEVGHGVGAVLLALCAGHGGW